MNVGVNGRGNPETNKVGHKTQNEDKKKWQTTFFFKSPTHRAIGKNSTIDPTKNKTRLLVKSNQFKDIPYIFYLFCKCKST